MADQDVRIVRVQRPASASGPWYLHDSDGGSGAFIDPAPQFESAMIDNVAHFEAQRDAHGVWRLLRPVAAPKA